MHHLPETRVVRHSEAAARRLAYVLNRDEIELNPRSSRWTYTPIPVGNDYWAIEIADEKFDVIGRI